MAQDSANDISSRRLLASTEAGVRPTITTALRANQIHPIVTRKKKKPAHACPGIPVNFKAPPFWHVNLELQFKQVKAQFATSKATLDSFITLKL
ncbi:Hypothetical protein CINCED_3A015315 [Cinara cedri]|uniref:Uncharacterized protein n=1 Tax=Cinara cedri TaxID=506608 RepID=A0A5E4M244_9HEMI|nr:Hypothetical protein CINCED_3A015315 [Cinara cedri]